MRRSCVATLLLITALTVAAARAPAVAAPDGSTHGNVEPALDPVPPNTVATDRRLNLP